MEEDEAAKNGEAVFSNLKFFVVVCPRNIADMLKNNDWSDLRTFEHGSTPRTVYNVAIAVEFN